MLTSFAVGSLPAVGTDTLVRVHFIDTRPSVTARVALAVINVYEKENVLQNQQTNKQTRHSEPNKP